MSLPNQTPQNVTHVQPPEAPAKIPNAQRRTLLSHPKPAMKKLSLVAVVLFVFLMLGSVTGVSAAAERVAGKLADKFVFFVHVAKLYTKDPDKTLAMPVQDVSKKQVANTWHAPRDGGRLHEGQDIFAPRGTAILSATEGYVANIGENSLGGQTVSAIDLKKRSPALKQNRRARRRDVSCFCSYCSQYLLQCDLFARKRSFIRTGSGPGPPARQPRWGGGGDRILIAQPAIPQVSFVGYRRLQVECRIRSLPLSVLY